MRKFKQFAIVLFTALAVFSCGDDYDDTAIRNDIKDLQSRVEKLETWCTSVNSQISALQVAVSALEANDYVTGVSPVEGGYTIDFSKSESITINHGKDGAKGADGVTPVIGVDKENGIYYWTVKTGSAAPTWLLDANKNKIRTTGEAAPAPTIAVAADTNGKLYWKVNGQWLMNGTAKVPVTGEKGADGEKGEQGEQGDAIFAADGVKVNENSVDFTLADGTTTFSLPRVKSTITIFKDFAEYKLNPVRSELTLDLDVKEDGYVALKAELTSSKGMTVAIAKATTRAAAGTAWGVSLTNPTFKTTDQTIETNAKVTFDLPIDVAEGDFALLKVTVVTKDGKEQSATRLIVYTTKVDVESVTIAATAEVGLDREKTLVATVLPATADQSVTWKSSDESIVTVSAEGKVKGIKLGGTATITVTTVDGGKTASCQVTVVEVKQEFSNENEPGIDGSGWDKAYKIGTKEDLILLAARINGTQSASWTEKFYKLSSNLTFTTEDTWTPIGNKSNPFGGHFDGGNYQILGVVKISTLDECIGFFGYGDGCEINNLHFAGSFDLTDFPGGAAYCAGIIGSLQNGVVTHCSNTTNISSATRSAGIVGFADKNCMVVACMNSGNVINANIGNAAGIAAALSESSSIIGCINKGNTIKSNNAYAGGVSGYGKGTHTACWSIAGSVKGGIEGGIIGGALGSATDCYWKDVSGLNGSSSGAITNSETDTFTADHPTVAQIKAMNDAWAAVDANREYKFNATTGEIEKITK